MGRFRSSVFFLAIGLAVALLFIFIRSVRIELVTWGAFASGVIECGDE